MESSLISAQRWCVVKISSSCQVPCDYIPRRSYPLYAISTAQEAMVVALRETLLLHLLAVTRSSSTPRSRALAWTAICAATVCLTSRR